MSLNLAYRYAKGEFAEVIEEIYLPIAAASKAAAAEGGRAALLAARASIAAAGFSRGWQNALRLDVFPKKGDSVNAVALIRHKIAYSDVFEQGAKIVGKPIMWVPLSTTPKKTGGKRMTPERFNANIGDLFTFRRGGKNPLLMAKMRIPKREAEAGPPYKIRLSALQRGSQAGRGVVVTVPVFTGVRLVNIKKKFNVTAAVEAAIADLPQLYLKNLKVD